MVKPTKVKALERLQAARDEIPDLKALDAESSRFKKWERNTEIAITNTFGDETRHIQDFTSIHYYVMYAPASLHETHAAYVKGLDSVASVLESMIDEIKEYWPIDDQSTTSATSVRSRQEAPLTNHEVFLVHGRDDGAKQTVARFLEQLQLEAVVLTEQPNQGRTIIEKFEKYAHVKFAIALLTPDDTGSLEGELQRNRARQNVIFELGYFIGKLGREGVCALTRGDVEIPSDYSGVVYIPLDDPGAWKLTLVKELKTAGFDVDANRAL